MAKTLESDKILYQLMDFEKLTESCIRVAKNLEKMIAEAESLFNRLLSTLNSSKFDAIKKEREIQGFMIEFDYATKKVYNYIIIVENIFQYCKKASKDIIADLKKDNYLTLLDFLAVLKSRISQAMEAYEEAKKECKAVQSQSSKVADLCKIKAEEARTKKTIVKVVGTGFGVVVGALAFAGSLPPSLGTVALAGTALSCIALSVCIPHYEEGERVFRSFSKDMNYLHTVSSTMLSELDTLNILIESLSRDREIVSNSVYNHPSSYTSIIRSAEFLFNAASTTCERSLPHLSKMKGMTRRL